MISCSLFPEIAHSGRDTRISTEQANFDKTYASAMSHPSGSWGSWLLLTALTSP